MEPTWGLDGVGGEKLGRLAALRIAAFGQVWMMALTGASSVRLTICVTLALVSPGFLAASAWFL